MHKHSSGFNTTRYSNNNHRHEKIKITANSPLSPEAFPFESATQHHHYDDDFHRPPPPSTSSFCGGGGVHDWSINDCTNRSVILSRADYDADWHILTANHYHHHQHQYPLLPQQQQLLNQPPQNPLTQQEQQQQQAKRVSLDASHMFWLSQHRNAARGGGHGMDLDELSFLDHDYGNAGGGGALTDEYDDSLRDSIDLDDFDEYDDEDDDETTMEENTHRQWLEHRRRLDLCMQKSQESRQQVMSLQPIQRSLLDFTLQQQRQPAPPQVPPPPPRQLSSTTSLSSSSSSSSSSTAFAQTQHSMRAVQDQLFGTTTTTTTADSHCN
jgi:hypothetical protein